MKQLQPNRLQRLLRQVPAQQNQQQLSPQQPRQLKFLTVRRVIQTPNMILDVGTMMSTIHTADWDATCVEYPNVEYVACNIFQTVNQQRQQHNRQQQQQVIYYIG